MSATQDQKGADFRELHEGEPFIAPNPWDAGSARVLEALGFKALATTSSGFAYTLGRLDGAASLDEVLDHVRSIDAATSLPVSVDLENGHGPFTLTARAENLIRGNPDLDDTIARLQAYEKAGADVLYAPGLSTTEDIAAVCGALSKPVNVLALGNLARDEIFAAGAQRISVGGGLAWVGVAAIAAAAAAMRDAGSFTSLSAPVPIKEWLS
jgi:2-methylisocitrate lyase-like PEP mutase family enzyme